MLIRRKTLERLLSDQQRSFEREREAFRRERADLLDRIMYLAERPWQPPPYETRPLAPPTPEPEQVVYPESMMPDEMLEEIS